MKRTLLVGSLLLVLLMTPAAHSQYYYGCQGYGQQRVQYWSQCQCYSCAYDGPGCTACFNEATGYSCYTSGQYCGGIRNQMP